MNSVKRWAQQPACRQDIIRRPTGRRTGQTSPLNLPSVVLPQATPPPGAHSSHGLKQKQAVAVPAVKDHLRRIQAVWKDVRAALTRSAARNKQLVYRHRSPTPEYKIINPTSVQLKLPQSVKINPTLHVSLLKPVSTCALNPLAKPPPPHRVIDDHPAFTMLRILDVRPRGRGFQYLVDWEGYGPEERSWISRKLILDPTILDDFYAAHPGKPGRTPGGVR
ncbi:uncharacterized protein LOC133487966 [Phyllopteryx taeniolatus]|uniref:uncharacterized protein LOC133487966 n=1 Tax=Phyllopteryx taeniolatus TaxID=161469 RepID=UPI002AD27235|nr:uncharacterized protein LOC133487966 [Phyllopteryx taeniolatus]